MFYGTFLSKSVRWTYVIDDGHKFSVFNLIFLSL